MLIKESLTDLLRRYGAYPQAIKDYEGLSAKEVWLGSNRGDRLLWIAAVVGVDRKLVVRAACDCARLALPFASGPEALYCIEMTERWCDGEATEDEVQKAGEITRVAANAVMGPTFYANYSAAYTATHTEETAYIAACAIGYRDKNKKMQALADCANVVRARIPFTVISQAAGKE